MTWNLNTVALLVPLCFLLIGLTVTVLLDPYISRKHRRVMLIIIVLSVLLVIQNVWENHLAAGPLRWGLRTTLAVCGYAIRPVFLVLFLYIVRPEKTYLGCWGLIVLNGLLHLTAFFSPLVFHIDESNHYQGGPLHSIGYDISMILLVYWLFQSFHNYRTSRKRDLLIPLLVALMVLSSVLLDRQAGLMEQPVTFLTFAIEGVVMCFVLLIWTCQEKCSRKTPKV